MLHDSQWFTLVDKEINNLTKVLFLSVLILSQKSLECPQTLPHPAKGRGTRLCSGPLWFWFKCYLSDRLHLTYIDGVCSDCLEVTSGVPQGSVLGPLLFLIYINDIPERISSSTYLFADNMKFLNILSSFSDSELLSSDISSLMDWCAEWSLNLNVSILHFLYCRV